MRRQLFSVVFCLLLVTVSSAVAKDSPSKSQEKPMLVPTVPPPTAEWPDFPGPDEKAKAGDTKPSGEAAVPQVKTPDAAAAASTTPGTAVETTPSTQPVAPDATTKEASAASPPELTPAQMEPHKRPVPAGYDAAAELYKAKKFPQAAKAFEAIIQKGAANVDTHLSLAYCYLLQRLYSKAAKEFEWVEK